LIKVSCKLRSLKRAWKLFKFIFKYSSFGWMKLYVLAHRLKSNLINGHSPVYVDRHTLFTLRTVSICRIVRRQFWRFSLFLRLFIFCENLDGTTCDTHFARNAFRFFWTSTKILLFLSAKSSMTWSKTTG